MDTLKQQVINILIGTLSNLGAKEIGKLAHGTTYVDINGNILGQTAPSINKLEQLLLHAGLGCATSGLGGNDCVSGAVSGVTGELAGELFGNILYKDNVSSIGGVVNFGELNQDQKNILKEIGGLGGALSAIFTGSMRNLDDDEIVSNMYNGQRLGKNAVENNLLRTQVMIDSKNVPNRGKYGSRKHPITKIESFHDGVDMVAQGTDKTIHASADGIVLKADYQYNEKTGTGWGYYVTMGHYDDSGNLLYITRFAHMAGQSPLKEGDLVQEGQPIGIMGNSGGSTGAHLHYELRQYNPQGTTRKEQWPSINPDRNIGDHDLLWQTPYQIHESEYEYHLNLLQLTH